MTFFSPTHNIFFSILFYYLIVTVYSVLKSIINTNILIMLRICLKTGRPTVWTSKLTAVVTDGSGCCVCIHVLNLMNIAMLEHLVLFLS